MTELVSAYGKALYSLAEDLHLEDEILCRMNEISGILKDNPEFIKMLNSPALPLEERHKILEDVLSGCEEILMNFIKLLTEERHMHIFSKCAMRFEEEYNEAHSIEKVTVESAFELKEAQVASIKAKLEELTGKKVVVSTTVVPELLGGIVVRTKDKQFDGTIARKLKDIQSEIHKVIV